MCLCVLTSVACVQCDTSSAPPDATKTVTVPLELSATSKSGVIQVNSETTPSEMAYAFRWSYTGLRAAETLVVSNGDVSVSRFAASMFYSLLLLICCVVALCRRCYCRTCLSARLRRAPCSMPLHSLLALRYTSRCTMPPLHLLAVACNVCIIIIFSI